MAYPMQFYESKNAVIAVEQVTCLTICRFVGDRFQFTLHLQSSDQRASVCLPKERYRLLLRHRDLASLVDVQQGEEKEGLFPTFS